MRIVLIGERFNQARHPGTELRCRNATLEGGEAAARYWRLMLRLGALQDPKSQAKLKSVGVPPGVHRANLLPPAPQGVPWWAQEAGAVAHDWWPRIRESYDAVLLCGGNVRRAFGLGLHSTLADEDLYGLPLLMGEEHGTWEPIIGADAHGTWGMLLPHPSGLCRFWNVLQDVELLRRDLEGMLS